MNEQAIKDAYDLFKTGGYNKSIDDFKKLISTNSEALNDSYELFKTGGYNKSLDDYKALMGVSVKKKVQSGNSTTENGGLVSEDPLKNPPPSKFQYIDPQTFDEANLPEAKFQPKTNKTNPFTNKPFDVPVPKDGYRLATEEEIDKENQNRPKTLYEKAFVGEDWMLPKNTKTLTSKQDLDAQLSKVNSELIDKEEEFVVPQLKQQFGDLGFKFEETGIGDAVNVTAPNGQKLTVNLDPFTSKTEKGQAEELKKFIKANAKPDKLTRLMANQDKYNQKIISEEEVKNSILTIRQEETQMAAQYQKLAEDQQLLSNAKIRKGLMERKGETNTQEYQDVAKYVADKEDYVDRLQTKLRGVQNKHDKNKSALDASVGKFHRMQKEQGTFGGGLRNEVLSGLDDIVYGVTDAEIDLMFWLSDKEKKEAKKQVKPAYKPLLGSENTTDKYVEGAGVIPGAIMSLGRSAPPMLAGNLMLPLMFLQSSAGLSKEMNNNPAFNDINEYEKRAITAPIALAEAMLEKLGFEGAMGKSKYVNNLVKRALDDTTVETGVDGLTEILKRNIDSDVAKGILAVGKGAVKGGLSEGATGGMQEISNITGKEIYNAIKDNPMFETPETFWAGVKQVAEAARDEAIGGIILGAVGSVSNAYNKDKLSKIDTKDVVALNVIGNNIEMMDAIDSDVQIKVNTGAITPEEGEEQINAVRNTIGLLNNLPDNLTAEQQKEALPLVQKLRDLEDEKERAGKVKGVVEPIQLKIDAINEKLAAIIKNPKPKKVPTPPATGGSAVEVEETDLQKAVKEHPLVKDKIDLFSEEHRKDLLENPIDWADERITGFNEDLEYVIKNPSEDLESDKNLTKYYQQRIQELENFKKDIQNEINPKEAEPKETKAEAQAEPIPNEQAQGEENEVVEPPKEEVKKVTGKFYRSETGFIQDKGTTAADVLNFEADENGNQDAIEAREKMKSLGIDLASVSHKDIVWVTKSKKAAKRYGKEVSEYDIKDGIVVIPDDGDGGMLIIKSTSKETPKSEILPDMEIEEDIINDIGDEDVADEIRRIENQEKTPKEVTPKPTKVSPKKSPTKSPETKNLENELLEAQSEVSMINGQIKAKAAEMAKSLIEDQSDIFGDRKSDKGKLFSQRINPDKINKVIKELKAKRDAAIIRVRAIQDKLDSAAKKDTGTKDIFDSNQDNTTKKQSKKKPTIAENLRKKYGKLDQINQRTLVLRFFATGGRINLKEAIARTGVKAKDLFGTTAKNGISYHTLYENVTDELGLGIGDIDQGDFDNMVDAMLMGPKSDIYKEINSHLEPENKQDANDPNDPANWTYEDLQIALRSVDPMYHDYIIEKINEFEQSFSNELFEQEKAEIERVLQENTDNGITDWESVSANENLQQLIIEQNETNNIPTAKTESDNKGDSSDIGSKENGREESKTLAKKIRSKKISGLGIHLDLGISKTIYNGALEIAAREVEKGTKLGKAIAKAIAWVDSKVNAKWDKKLFAAHLADKFKVTLNNQEVEVKVDNSQVTAELINGFYSPLENGINNAKYDKATGDVWLKRLRGETEGEELKWTGTEKYLTDNFKKELSKKDLLNFFKANRIEIAEVGKGFGYGESVGKRREEIEKELEENGYTLQLDMGGDGYMLLDADGELTEYDENPEHINAIWEEYNEISDSAFNQHSIVQPSDAKYEGSRYNLSGPYSEYREMLILLPSDKKRVEPFLHDGTWIEDPYSDEDGKPVDPHVYYGIPREDLPKFQSSHWDEPNVIVHLRSNIREDSEGNKIYFIEEIQSDWGQIGREKGFIYNAELTQKEIELKKLRDKGLDNLTAEEKKIYSDLMVDGTWRSLREKDFGATPPAPFVTELSSYTKLGIKLALKEAVKAGANKIAWTTGEQQNIRNSLSSQVDELSYVKNSDGTYHLIGKKGDREIVDKKGVEESKLADYVGKDVAQKIREEAGEETVEMVNNEIVPFKSLTGKNLEVGGKAMRRVYGSIKDNEVGLIGDIFKSLTGQEVGTIKLGDAVTYLSAKEALIEFEKGREVYVERTDESEYLVEEEKEIEEAEDNGSSLFIEKSSQSTQFSIEITPPIIESVKSGIPLFKGLTPNEQIRRGLQKIKAIPNKGIARDITSLPAEVIEALADIAIGYARRGGDAMGEYIKFLRGKYKDYLKNVSDKELEALYKKANGIKEERKPGQVKKTIATIRAYEGDIREGVKKVIESLGLYRERESWADAKARAQEFIKQVGYENALEAVRNNDVDGGAGAFVWNEILENVNRQMLTETDPQKMAELEALQGKLFQEFSAKALSKGRFGAALYEIYQNSDLGYNVEKKISDWKEEHNGTITPDMEAKFREIDRELKELKEKLAKAEERAREAEKRAKEAEAVAGIKESIEREKKQRVSAKIRQETDRLLKKVQEAKIHRPGMFMSATPASIIWDGAVNAVELSIKAGGRTAEAIAKGVEFIKGSSWYNGLTPSGQDQAIKEFEGWWKEKPKAEVVDGKLSIPTSLIRELVAGGIDNIEDLTEAVKQLIEVDVPGITTREIRDAITDYGKVVNVNKEQIAMEIRKMKRIGRILSGLEDIAEKKRPLRSGMQRDTLDAQERALQKELREAMKELPLDAALEAEQQKTATDALKRRLKNQIEDLEREIAKGVQVPRSARTIQMDQEIQDLKDMLAAVKKRHDAVFKNEAYEAAKRLEMAKKRTTARIAELQRRIREKDFAPKKKVPIIEDTELANLRAEKIRIQNKYDVEFYKDKILNRTAKEKAVDFIWDLWGLTRVLRATGEFSFVLIQGLIQSYAHPKNAVEAFKVAWKNFKSESASEKFIYDIKAQTWYPQLKQSKLALTEAHADVTAREELFYSEWSNLIWDTLGLPFLLAGKTTYKRWTMANPVRAIERASVGFLDTMRVLRWLDGKEMLEAKGIKQEDNPKAWKEMADVINTMTGRASLGAAEMIAPQLTKIFFSPRNWASVFKTASPYALIYFGSKRAGAEGWKPSVAQKIALMDYIKFIGLTTAMVSAALVYLNSDDDEETGVETDPTSSDYMKIKIGNKRIDPWGGRQQEVVLTARLIAGMFGKPIKKTDGRMVQLGTQYQTSTMGGLLADRLTNKLAPSAGMFWRYMNTHVDASGKRIDKWGQDYDFTQELKDNLYPIYWETLSELMQDDPGALDGLLVFYTFFGGSVNIYEPKQPKGRGPLKRPERQARPER